MVGEILGLTLMTIHNISFYRWLMAAARKQIIDGSYGGWKAGMVRALSGEGS
jgi:queuine tRNA-ribosyltransferase